jgi:tetratricopeptide (TPR) repeat protein
MNDEKKRFETLRKQLSREELLEYSSKIRKQKEKIEKNPSEALLWKELAIFYEIVGEFTKALEAHSRAIELNPTNAELWTEKGITFFKKFLQDDDSKNEEDAIKCFNKALELNDKYAPAWAYKANLLMTLPKYEEALKSFEKALEIQEKASYWEGRAFCLFHLQRTDEAFASWDKAIELEKDVADHWENKAFAYSRLGKIDEVIQCLEKATEINSHNAETWLNLALLYQQRRRQEQAINAVDKALVLNPLNVYAHMLKATLLTERGPFQNLKEAINIMKIALDMDPNDPTLIFNYAKILFLDAQYAECHKQLERMLSLGTLLPQKLQQEAKELYQFSRTLAANIEQQKKQSDDLRKAMKERNPAFASATQLQNGTFQKRSHRQSDDKKEQGTTQTIERPTKDKQSKRSNKLRKKQQQLNVAATSTTTTSTTASGSIPFVIVATVACVVGFGVWKYFSRRK